MLYGVSRFNAWIGATGCEDQSNMRKVKQEILDYFVSQYNKILDENLEDYIENFEEHMR